MGDTRTLENLLRQCGFSAFRRRHREIGRDFMHNVNTSTVPPQHPPGISTRRAHLNTASLWSRNSMVSSLGSLICGRNSRLTHAPHNHSAGRESTERSETAGPIARVALVVQLNAKIRATRGTRGKETRPGSPLNACFKNADCPGAIRSDNGAPSPLFRACFSFRSSRYGGCG